MTPKTKTKEDKDEEHEGNDDKLSVWWWWLTLIHRHQLSDAEALHLAQNFSGQNMSADS